MIYTSTPYRNYSDDLRIQSVRLLLCTSQYLSFEMRSVYIAIATFYLVCNHVAPSIGSTSNSEYKRELAVTVFRHGNRTFALVYPNSPYVDPANWPDYWPKEYVLLTDAGREVHFKHGKYLRKRYADLLEPDCSPNKIYLQSTDTQRTITSAKYNTGGIFAPRKAKWQDALQYQPVPLVVTPLAEDYFLYQFLPCPKMDQIQATYLSTIEMDARINSKTLLRTYLEKYSGTTIKTVFDFYSFYDVLNLEKLTPLHMEDWEKYAFEKSNDMLEYYTSLWFQSTTIYTEMKKARCGFFLKNLFNLCKQKSLGQLESEAVLYNYFAHETTVANLLNCMGVYKLQAPPFGAGVFFELLSRKKKSYVQMFYREGDTNDLPPLSIPGCGTMCPLDKLIGLFDDIIPKDDETYAAMCQA